MKIKLKECETWSEIDATRSGENPLDGIPGVKN
jgi:hypothetical protein